MSGSPRDDEKPPHVPDDRGMRRNMADWRPSRRALLITLAAFAAGLLLFVLLWWRDRGTNDFYRAQAPSDATQGQVFEPLPAPLPAGSGDSAGRIGQDQSIGGQASDATVEPAVPPPRAAPTAPPPSPPPPARVAPAPGDSPVPVSAPAPSYPTDALRRGESGTVLLRVHVGPDGVPYEVDLVRSSHSRSLDRAASDAVKRWRFRPAQRNGVPVAAAVQVPIVFNASR
jgi:protein TonB